ncbi:24440_t:CDS:2, partial [Gigaspora rosea]
AYKVPNILYIVEDDDDNKYKAYEQNINNLDVILIKCPEHYLTDAPHRNV